MAENRRGTMTGAQTAALGALGAAFAQSAAVAESAISLVPGKPWRELAAAIEADVRERSVVAQPGEIAVTEPPAGWAALPELRARFGSEVAHVVPGTVFPGRWTLYRARRSGVVVGFDGDVAAARCAYQQTWLAAHGMSATTLAENRAGRLTAEQRAAIAQSARESARGRVIALIAAVGALAWLALRIVDAIDRRGPLPSSWLGPTALLALAAIAAAAVAVQQHRAAARAGDVHVEHRAGPLRKRCEVGGHRTIVFHTFIEVGGLDVEIPHELYAALVPGLSHRIFVAAGRCLSIELAEPA